jgi:hypothetical protein
MLHTIERSELGSGTSKCALCGVELTSFKYRPMAEWNISGMLCSRCYDKKLLDHYVQPDRRNITKR